MRSSSEVPVRGRVVKLAFGIAGIVLGIGVAAGVWLTRIPGRTPAGQPPLVTIRAETIGTVESRFDAAREKWRIVALLSPT